MVYKEMKMQKLIVGIILVLSLNSCQLTDINMTFSDESSANYRKVTTKGSVFSVNQLEKFKSEGWELIGFSHDDHAWNIYLFKKVK